MKIRSCVLHLASCILLLLPLAARAQSPYPSPGPTPLARGARLNSNGSMMFGPADLATYTPDAFRHSTDTDDTVAVQAAINAAIAAAPAKVLLSRVYYISGAITGNVTPGTGITIEGVNQNCGFITSLATSDIFFFAPTGTPSLTNLNSGMRWMTFKNFFVDSSVTRTSGAAFHIQWSDSTGFDHVRIGSFNYTVPGSQLPIYDGIFMDKQSNCYVTFPQIYCSDVGFTTTGATTGGTAYFSFGGYIGGGGYMYGNYATPSIGIHIAGMNGGFELGDFDCGQWGKYSLLCDEALASGTNHELFIGRCFLDSPGVCSAYIGTNSLYILELHDAWMAGAGRLPGLVFAPGAGYSPENGCGVYIQAPQAGLHVNVSSGTHIYANNADGILVGDCLSFVCMGADVYGNGINGTSGSGEHGIEVQGGSNVLLIGNNLTNNVGCSYLIRGTDSGTYFGVGGASGSCAGCFAYDVFANDGGGSGTPLGIEENASSRTPNMYAGFTMGGAGNISNGPFPSQFTLAYNESPTTAGASLGVNTTPRLLLSTGTTAQGWEWDNNAGTLRTSQNGITYQSFTSSALTLQNGANLTLNSAGGPTIAFTSTGLNSTGVTAGTGLKLTLDYNATGNKQLLLYDPDYASSSTGAGFRVLNTAGVVSFDAVNGTNTTAEPISTDSPFTFKSTMNVNNSAGTAATPVLYTPTITLSGSSIDWSLLGPFAQTIAANTTYTFANASDGQPLTVYITNTGSYTVTWPTVKWQTGTPPTQTTGAHTDEYTFRKVGSLIYGSVKQNY